MSEILDIARVNRQTLEVENIERASQDWIDANANDEQYMFVVTPDVFGTHAVIGLHYDTEFELFSNPYAYFPPVGNPLEPDFEARLAAYEARQQQ